MSATSEKPARRELSAELSGIFEAYHGRVRAYATKLIGRDAADDVVQEVFVKVGVSLETLGDPSKLTSWIYAITLNTVRDALRRRSVRPEDPVGGVSPCGDETGEAPLERIADTAARTPEQAAIRDEMVACYLDYVRQLPRNYYDVYVLDEFAELPDQEIARRLSLSVGTVKIRLHRARARLHDALRRNCQCYYNERGELMGEPKRC